MPHNIRPLKDYILCKKYVLLINEHVNLFIYFIYFLAIFHSANCFYHVHDKLKKSTLLGFFYAINSVNPTRLFKLALLLES